MCVYAMAMFTNDIPGGAIHKLSERCNRVLSLSLLCSVLHGTNVEQTTIDEHPTYGCVWACDKKQLHEILSYPCP